MSLAQYIYLSTLQILSVLYECRIILCYDDASVVASSPAPFNTAPYPLCALWSSSRADSLAPSTGALLAVRAAAAASSALSFAGSSLHDHAAASSPRTVAVNTKERMQAGER
jgi:hypothetical protein